MQKRTLSRKENSLRNKYYIYLLSQSAKDRRFTIDIRNHEVSCNFELCQKLLSKHNWHLFITPCSFMGLYMGLFVILWITNKEALKRWRVYTILYSRWTLARDVGDQTSLAYRTDYTSCSMCSLVMTLLSSPWLFDPPTQHKIVL